MSGSNQNGLRWSKTKQGDYVCGGYRIHRFKSGLRGSTVQWHLSYMHKPLPNPYIDGGGYNMLREAKQVAWNRARGIGVTP